MDSTLHPTVTTAGGLEPPELLARNIRVGSRLWAASQAFFFISFFFAFLYLRALNTNGLWRGWPHHHPDPSMAFGVVILICVLAGAAVARASIFLSSEVWRLCAGAAALLLLAAVGLQAAQSTLHSSVTCPKTSASAWT